MSTSGYGKDQHARTAPPGPDKRIPESALPPNPPPKNGYYGSHQEFFLGDATSTDRAARRDALTGGFPAGMLRLSECLGLPEESTCSLIASSGFNSCIARLATDPTFSINTCFENLTSYAGMRACDAGSPCRDDYICVRPMGYTPETAGQRYDDRRQRLANNGIFKEINNRDYDPDDFGQQRPDPAWVQRNDQRGVCIPPYFVFQFRSDGHPRRRWSPRSRERAALRFRARDGIPPVKADSLHPAALSLRGAAPGLRGAALSLRGAAPGLHGAALSLHGAALGLHGAAPGLRGAAPGSRGAAHGLRSAAPGLRSAARGLHGAAAGSHGAAPGRRRQRPPAGEFRSPPHA